MSQKYYIVKLNKAGDGYIVGKASSILDAMLMARPERGLILVKRLELKRRWPEVVKAFEAKYKASGGQL